MSSAHPTNAASRPVFPLFPSPWAASCCSHGLCCPATRPYSAPVCKAPLPPRRGPTFLRPLSQHRRSTPQAAKESCNVHRNIGGVTRLLRATGASGRAVVKSCHLTLCGGVCNPISLGNKFDFLRIARACDFVSDESQQRSPSVYPVFHCGAELII